MNKAGVTSLFDLDKDTLASLTKDCAKVVTDELAAVGIEVKVSADGTVTGVVKNTETGKANTVVSTTNVIKQTGSDMTATVVASAAVVGAIAACGVVAKKKGLFSKAEA